MLHYLDVQMTIKTCQQRQEGHAVAGNYREMQDTTKSLHLVLRQHSK